MICRWLSFLLLTSLQTTQGNPPLRDHFAAEMQTKDHSLTASGLPFIFSRGEVISDA